MQSGPVQISVVVCVKDDWRVLRLLESLASQSVDPSIFEVIIVSTGAERYDISAQRFGLRVRVAHSPIARHSVQRNIGLHLTLGRYFASTDADCVPSETWLEDILNAFESAPPRLAGVGGAIGKLRNETLVQKHGITIDAGQPSLNYLPALDLPYVTGANAAYRTDAVRSIGGYDEQFLCGDDVDLSYRLGLAGYHLKVIDSARILHEDRRSLTEHFHRFRFYAVDQALLFKKYRGYSGKRMHLNTYPWLRLAEAVKEAAGHTSHPPDHRAGVPRAMATLAEASGVLVGDLEGSIRHRVIYV